jgi:hypothetical protein
MSEQINAEVLAKCDELEAEIVTRYDALGEHLKKKLAEIRRIRRMFEGKEAMP